MNNSIIMVPYANCKNMKGGVNINDNKRFDIYLKNCIISLLSAKEYNPDSDVAFVTNIELPEEHEKVLRNNNILIIKAEFSHFVFPNDYKWGLAFYKLCALKYVVENYNYGFYSYLDSDVYIQSSFDNIFDECKDNMLLYDINHGLQVRDYRLFLEDYHSFTGSGKNITHYGGEFFAASRENAEIFISECHKIYSKMINENFITSFGDEFIISQVAEKQKALVKNAGAYVYRFWTGDFHLVSTCYKYNPIAVIHVPSEKTSGMVNLYNRYFRKGKFPTNEKVHSILGLKHMRLKLIFKLFIKRIIRRK